MTTRSNALASYHAALRQADEAGHLVLTAASAAGMVLEGADGDVETAVLMLGPFTGTFWRRVRAVLEEIELDDALEAADRGEALMSAMGAR
jgi:hypothetical protein